MDLSEVLRNVTYLASRDEGVQRINLYRLNLRLYEIWYHTGTNTVTSVKETSWHEARKVYKERELLLSPN